MVGMSILSILMLMMFRFVISAQKVLDLSDSTWGIYENSRIVFDLIERDLQSAVASSIGGEEIPFYTGDQRYTDAAGTIVKTHPERGIDLAALSIGRPTGLSSKIISGKLDPSRTTGIIDARLLASTAENIPDAIRGYVN